MRLFQNTPSYIQAPSLDLRASAMPDQSSNPLLQAFKNGIARVENANYNEGNKYSSAFGKYQFTAPTLEAVRENHFPNINKKDFTNTYKTDPNFQERVMDAYGSYLLSRYKDPHQAATAFFLGEGKANFYNQPEYRPTPNNLTVGKYLSTFDKGYGKFEDGGGTGPGPQTPLQPKSKDVVDTKSVDYLNSYFQSQTFKDRFLKYNTDNEYKEQMNIFNQESKKFNPFILENDPKNDRIGSRVSNPIFNKVWGTPQNTNIVLSKPQAKEIGANLYNDVLPHEYTHTIRKDFNGTEDIFTLGFNKNAGQALDKYTKWMNSGKKQTFEGWSEEKMGNSKGHDISPSEQYADLNALRWMMYKEGIYDTRKGDMKLEDIQKAMKNKNIQNTFMMKRILQHFTPANIVRFNNTIASNDFEDSDEARHGGHVMNKPEGMMLPFNPQMKMQGGGEGPEPKPRYNIPNAYMFDMMHPNYTPTQSDSLQYRQIFEAAQKDPSKFNYQQLLQKAKNNYLMHNELGYDQNRANYLRDANTAAAVWDAQNPTKFEEGGEYHLTNIQIKQLKKLGYKIDIISND